MHSIRTRLLGTRQIEAQLLTAALRLPGLPAGAPGEEEVPLIDTGHPTSTEGDIELGRQNSAKRQPRTKLGLLPLVALIFYEVSGGPFGTEVTDYIVHWGCFAKRRSHPDSRDVTQRKMISYRHHQGPFARPVSGVKSCACIRHNIP